jgi:peptidoglycan/xylan/chitin deacetylase (PgdA/CDA1 family)
MAELDVARPHGVFPHRRRKGFLAFCAALVALIGLFVLTPIAAGAGRPAAKALDAARASRPRAAAEAPAAEAEAETPPASEPVASTEPPGPTLQRLIDAGEPVFCGAGTQPLVALTFDDGPGPLTGQTLDLLRRRGMTATFFVAGKLVGTPWIDDTLVPRAARLGEIGDHSFDHISMVGLSQAELEGQIARTRRLAARAAGERVVLFRPPLGRHDERVRDYLRSIGMLTVMWSLESRDSQGDNAVKIYRTIRAGLSAGDIILLHENRGTTQKALPQILDLIEQRGLRTVTVSELLTLDPPTPEQLRSHSCPA